MLYFISMWDSPFIVPVATFAMVLGIVIAGQVAQYQKRRLQSEERLAAIARGLPLPPEPLPEPLDDNPYRRVRGIRTAAIMLTASSLGVIFFAFCLVWILDSRTLYIVAAAAAIPLTLGIGFFIDYRIQTRELEQLAANPPSSNLTPRS